MLLSFKIEVDKIWSMKNNNRIRKSGNRIFVGKEQALIRDKNYLILKLRQAWEQKPAIQYPVHATFIFHFANFYTKQNKMNMRLGDLTNIIQLPEDCLQSAGVIQDDCLIYSLDGSRKYPSKDDKNYIEIHLQKFTE